MIAPGGSGVGFQAAGGPTVVTSSTTTQATASSFYVLAYYASTGAVTSVTDTFSNTYTAVTAEVADVSDGGFIRVYQTQNGAGGAGHVATVHLSPTEIGMAIFVEVTGGSTSSILDTQNAVYGTAGSPFACNVTTANPIDLLLGFIISASASTSESFTSTLLTNSITQFNFSTSALGAGAALSVRVTSTGTYNAAISDSAGYLRALVALLALKESAASTATIAWVK